MLISKWNDTRRGELAARVGWTVRLANGKLAIVTDVFTRGYLAKVIEPQPTEPEQTSS